MTRPWNGCTTRRARWAQDLGDVFTPAGTERFMAWLTAPAVRGGAYGVNRYVFDRVLRERGDVVDAFPDLDHGDGPSFVDWCRTRRPA